MSTTAIHKANRAVKLLEEAIRKAPELTERGKISKGLLEAQLKAARASLQCAKELGGLISMRNRGRAVTV